MKLDFSEKNRQGEPATYKEQAEELIAASKQNCIYTKDRKPEDAFMLLIKGLGYDELDNLCDILNRCYAYPQDECYAITQGTSSHTMQVFLSSTQCPSSVSCLQSHSSALLQSS